MDSTKQTDAEIKAEAAAQWDAMQAAWAAQDAATTDDDRAAAIEDQHQRDAARRAESHRLAMTGERDEEHRQHDARKAALAAAMNTEPANL